MALPSRQASKHAKSLFRTIEQFFYWKKVENLKDSSLN